jgi:hypothetical protein
MSRREIPSGLRPGVALQVTGARRTAAVLAALTLTSLTSVAELAWLTMWPAMSVAAPVAAAIPAVALPWHQREPRAEPPAGALRSPRSPWPDRVE